MKLKEIFLTIALFIFLAIFISAIFNVTTPEHICVDNTHKTCDGVCECDGLGCNTSGITFKGNGHWEKDTDGTVNYYEPPTKAIQYVNAYDYQLDISSIPDSILVMDGHRHVGTIPMWDKSPLDSLLWKDNE